MSEQVDHWRALPAPALRDLTVPDAVQTAVARAEDVLGGVFPERGDDDLTDLTRVTQSADGVNRVRAFFLDADAAYGWLEGEHHAGLVIQPNGLVVAEQGFGKTHETYVLDPERPERSGGWAASREGVIRGFCTAHEAAVAVIGLARRLRRVPRHNDYGADFDGSGYEPRYEFKHPDLRG